MIYQCPKGHQSTDSDYCSECGTLIGQSKIVNVEPVQTPTSNKPSGAPQEICPDCGTPREGNGRFCEVCRHDFQDNKTGMAEAIVASQQPSKPVEDIKPADKEKIVRESAVEPVKAVEAEAYVVSQKLNILISVDRDKASSWDGDSPIKPDTKDRVFPLDLDENLVGRRSQGKGVYPEIEINDPGVSHRHLKFIKQPDGSFDVLELGSSNGTELNGAILEARPGGAPDPRRPSPRRTAQRRR
jgi:uncharacterized Zn finger protein (UPF0148 family)